MKNSIIAGKMARDLTAELGKAPKVGMVASAYHHNGRYDLFAHARLCTVKGKASGGVYLWADADAPTYASRRVKSEKRLKAGWTEQSLYRHVADLVETVRQIRADPLIRLREHVYALSESKEFDPEKLPRESSCFDDMLEEECQFWVQWLNQQPNKKAE